MLRECFENMGVNVVLSSVVEGIDVSDGKADVLFKGKSTSETFDIILVSIGRKAYISNLQLDKAGVEKSGDAVQVNEFLQATNSPHIFGWRQYRWMDVCSLSCL
jgi:pyruvate/2-oxoglutarate dehydrogenase complex dihydrolipoamide dehydrogenase (E3) component